MKQLKRLDTAMPADIYRRAQRGLIRHLPLPEADFRALEREHPDRIVVDGDALLIGQPRHGRIDLQYSFPNHDAFLRQFPAMLERLLPAVRQETAPLGLRFCLTERSSRPFVEPVLSASAFEMIREWLEMVLLELPEDGPATDEIAPGFVLRPAQPDDLEAIVRLEDLAFPTAVFTVELAREALGTGAVYRVLEERVSGTLVGSLLAERGESATGHISTVALHPDYQRRGLGEATMRWVLGWFRAEGLRRATLTVSTWNAPAIALYRKLGFTVGEMGFDYRRLIDEAEVRQVLEKGRAPHISVRRRF